VRAGWLSRTVELHHAASLRPRYVREAASWIASWISCSARGRRHGEKPTKPDSQTRREPG
jgi:hypothetical protein